MFRTYLALGALMLGVFSYAQYRNWSLYGSDAQQQTQPRSSARSGTGSLYSGHK